MASVMEARRRILLNTPHIETSSGGVANFKTDMIAPLKGCKVNFLPKQSGSGDPSPTNIRPISGWDGVTVTRCGKNLIDKTLAVRSERYNAGGITSTPDRCSRTALIKINPSTDYYFTNVVPAIDFSAVWWYDKDGVNVGYKAFPGTLNAGTSGFVTSPSTACYVGVNFYYNDTDTVMMHEGNSATPYEPYTASTFPVSWAQQGTVYGGYVDLVSGEVWSEWELITLDNLLWEYSTTYDWFYSKSLRDVIKKPATSIIVADAICSSYTIIAQNDNTRKKGIAIWTSGNMSYLNSGEYASVSDFVSAVSGVQFAYELGTPQLIATLTPTQIKTLKSINNIFSNADSAEVKFWTH